MGRLLGLLGALVVAAWLSATPALATSVTASPAVSPEPTPTASWLASPEPEPSPFRPGGGADVPIAPYLLQLLVVTAVVAGLAYISLKFAQKKLPALGTFGAAGKQLRIIERLAVDPKRLVFVVNVGDRYWLMAATDTSVTTVAELSKADLGLQFAQLLEQEKHRGDTL